MTAVVFCYLFSSSIYYFRTFLFGLLCKFCEWPLCRRLQMALWTRFVMDVWSSSVGPHRLVLWYVRQCWVFQGTALLWVCSLVIPASSHSWCTCCNGCCLAWHFLLQWITGKIHVLKLIHTYHLHPFVANIVNGSEWIGGNDRNVRWNDSTGRISWFHIFQYLAPRWL